jgi:hypothetical protein
MKISEVLKSLTFEQAETNLSLVYEDEFDYNLVVASYMLVKNLDYKTAKSIVDYEHSQIDQMEVDNQIRSSL